jgi:CO dehydrogenase/acetyl-CoA synthase delta subunit
MTIVSNKVFSTAIIASGLVSSRLIAVMNQSTAFQAMFDVLDALKVPIALGAKGAGCVQVHTVNSRPVALSPPKRVTNH